MEDLRRVELQNADGSWSVTSLKHLNEGDVFRMFETDGDEEQLGPYVAISEPSFKDNSWGIEVMDYRMPHLD